MMRRKIRRDYPRPGKCQFCKSKTLPDYKEVAVLRQFVSDRGRIITRVKTGICAKHQRRLSREVKRARYLALLPFLTRV